MTDSTVSFNQDLAFELFSSTEKFPVDFDRAWVWLGYSDKATAKRFLTNSRFKQGRDFSADVLKNAERGRSSHFIRLTADCLKCWGMKVETEQGDLIREYFLECERLTKEKQAKKLPEELLVDQAIALLEARKEILAIQAKQAEQELLNQKLIEEQKFQEAQLDHHTGEIIGLKAEVGRYGAGTGSHYTILAWATILGIKDLSLPQASKLGKKASKLCRQLKVLTGRTRDVRFGIIKTYPEFVLEQIDFKAAA